MRRRRTMLAAAIVALCGFAAAEVGRDQPDVDAQPATPTTTATTPPTPEPPSIEDARERFSAASAAFKAARNAERAAWELASIIDAPADPARTDALLAAFTGHPAAGAAGRLADVLRAPSKPAEPGTTRPAPLDTRERRAAAAELVDLAALHRARTQTRLDTALADAAEAIALAESMAIRARSEPPNAEQQTSEPVPSEPPTDPSSDPSTETPPGAEPMSGHLPPAQDDAEATAEPTLPIATPSEPSAEADEPAATADASSVTPPAPTIGEPRPAETAAAEAQANSADIDQAASSEAEPVNDAALLIAASLATLLTLALAARRLRHRSRRPRADVPELADESAPAPDADTPPSPTEIPVPTAAHFKEWRPPRCSDSPRARPRVKP